MPAKKVTIFPQLSPDAHALLLRVCEAQGCAPGVVIEAALQALLNPQEVTDRDAAMIQALVRVHEGLEALLALQKQYVAVLAAEHPPAVKVATFGNLYPDTQGGV